MTTPPVGPSAIRDIPAVHAAIAPSAVLRQQRRVLYQLASELLLGDGPQALDSNLMDSPLARHSIGNALAGRTKLSRSALVGISAVAPARGGVQHLRVTSLPVHPRH
jgi:hypothetical protein